MDEASTIANSESIATMGEFAFIDWLRRRTPAAARVLIGPGDDTAAVPLTPGAPGLVANDKPLEGSRGRLAEAGPLGGSILAKHLDFTPRVREALQLHAVADLHAMIDISDGMAADVHHLCEESRCGAMLRAEAIPITAAARGMNDGRSPLEHA